MHGNINSFIDIKSVKEIIMMKIYIIWNDLRKSWHLKEVINKNGFQGTFDTSVLNAEMTHDKTTIAEAFDKLCVQVLAQTSK